MKEQLKKAELTASSTSTENEERRVAAVKKEYEEQISSLNEQISIMEQALKEEEEKTNKMKEEMDVESTSLPKGVLPANFFDDHVEGAVAMGMKRKEAEKQLKEYFVFAFNNS